MPCSAFNRHRSAGHSRGCRCSGRDGVVPGRDGGPRGRVGDAVRRQACEFEEHLFQAAGDHEGEEPAASCLIDIHLKRTSYQEALHSGRLRLEGPRQLREAFLTWIRPSPYADIVPALGHAPGGVPG